MFEYDIELISNAVTNISESLKKLEGKKANINNILNFGYKSYKNKESLEKVCEDLLEVIKEISDLKSDSEIMKKRITNIDLGDNIELESPVFSSDVVGTLKIGENLNVKDLNQDKYEVLELDKTIEIILNSDEYTEEEKERFKNNYEKENYSAISYMSSIHELNKELESIEEEISKLTEEEYSKKEELNASKLQKQQEIYDTKKLLELAEFEYLDYLIGTEEFIEYSKIENITTSAFEYLKVNIDLSAISAFGLSPEEVFRVLSLYVTNLSGSEGEYGLADRLYLEQIIESLCKDENFRNYLMEIGVSREICSDEQKLFATLIQYQQQGVSYAYTMMTEDEKSKLNYLYQTDSKEADKYVLALEDTLNSRYGYELAMRDVEKILNGETSVEETFTSLGVGIIPGMRSFGDNTKACLTGDDTKTYTDYQIEYVSQIISEIYYANGVITKDELDTFLDNEVITNEQYNQLSNNLNQTRLDVLLMTNQITEEEYDTLKEFGENLDTENELVLTVSNSIGVSIGNQLPAMLTSYATMGVTGSAGLAHTLANVMMFLSSSGASYKEAKWKGYDGATARIYGAVAGAAETTLDYFLGKMPGISKMEHYMSDVKSVRKLLASLAWNCFQEGAEEFIQVDVENVINHIILGEPIDLKFYTPEKGIAFVSGFISSGMTQVTVQTAGGLVDITFGEIVSYVKSDGTIDVNKFQSDLENNEIGTPVTSTYNQNIEQVNTLNTEFTDVNQNHQDSFFDNITTKLENVFDTIEQKFGLGTGLKTLLDYAETGDIHFIPDVVRSEVASIPISNIKNYLRENNIFVSEVEVASNTKTPILNQQASHAVLESTDINTKGETQTLDSIIENLDEDSYDFKGNSRKCYYVTLGESDYALLAYDAEDTDKVTHRINTTRYLVDQGLKTPNIVDFRYDGNKVYEMQERADGDILFPRKRSESYKAEVATSLELLSNASGQQLMDFMNNVIILRKNNCTVDCHSDNFMIDENSNITLIDLNLANDIKTKELTSSDYRNAVNVLPNIFSFMTTNLTDAEFDEFKPYFTNIAKNWLSASYDFLEANNFDLNQSEGLLNQINLRYLDISKEEQTTLINQTIESKTSEQINQTEAVEVLDNNLEDLSAIDTINQSVDNTTDNQLSNKKIESLNEKAKLDDDMHYIFDMETEVIDTLDNKSQVKPVLPMDSIVFNIGTLIRRTEMTNLTLDVEEYAKTKDNNFKTYVLQDISNLKSRLDEVYADIQNTGLVSESKNPSLYELFSKSKDLMAQLQIEIESIENITPMDGDELNLLCLSLDACLVDISSQLDEIHISPKTPSKITLRELFSKFVGSDVYDGYYGADQNAFKKHKWFSVLNMDWLTGYETQFVELLANQENRTQDEIRKEYIEPMYERIKNGTFSISGSLYAKINDALKTFFADDIDGYLNVMKTSFATNYDDVYKNMLNKLTECGLSEIDATQVLDFVDSKGGHCSYAAFANEIFNKFANNPEGFEKMFGYSMFTENNGKTILNSSELILDMIMFVNSDACGGNQFHLDTSNNSYSVININNNSSTLYTPTTARIMQHFLRYKSYQNGGSTDINYSISVINNNTETYELSDSILKQIEAGKTVTLGINYNPTTENPIFLRSKTGVKASTFLSGGHIVTVTGANSEGIYVASWAREYFVEYKDITNNPYATIYVGEIGGIE